MEIFNTHLEFNREALFNAIELRISSKNTGYICVCDSSVITRVHKDLKYRKLVNNAFINTCDGSAICTMAKWIYGGHPESINGPELFARYTQMQYKQVIIGNTEPIVQKVREKLRSEGKDDSHITHLQVPFCKVDEFDYQGIAEEINKQGYDIIWVSLGNPKQEIFCSKLQPFLNKGVLFGIGAALNFWCGDLKLPNPHIGPLKFIWFTRMFQDPKRQIKGNWRVLKALPSIYYQEWKRKKSYNK